MTFSNPYTPAAKRFKGQLHTHSSNSGYVDEPFTLYNSYRSAGYDFVAITDYEAGGGGNYTSPIIGIDGLLALGGAEEMVAWRTKVPHFGTVGVDQEWTTELNNNDPQVLVNAVHANGGLIAVNHPAFTTLTLIDVIDIITMGYDFLEIYNAQLDAEAASFWDAALSAGLQVYATTVDDSHDYSAQGNKAWIVVQANDLTKRAILDALHAGNFYASTGPTMRVTLTGNTIRVTTDARSTIEWIGENGAVLRSSSGVSADVYTPVVSELYVRIKITRDYDDHKAWSQPLFRTA